MNNWLRYWVIPASVVVALMLTMLPLPSWAQPWRPDWVSLVVIYWVIALPRAVGVGTGWVCGFLVDLVQGTLLGQHAFGLALISYIAARFHQRIRVYPMVQQCLLILILLSLMRLFILWVNGITGHAPDNALLFFAPTLVGALLWPLVCAWMRAIHRRQKLR